MGNAHAIGAGIGAGGVTAPPARRIEIVAPAKLNLGLEVIARRGDGYHELATIFLAVGLCDRLTLSPLPFAGRQEPLAPLSFTSSDPSLTTPDNLVLRALHALREETGFRGGADVHLHKMIPAAAGLGGASSDAAAALLAARELWRLDLLDEGLANVAAAIGSDAPFFLRGRCALGRGRGEILESLPVPEGLWFVLVVPRVTMAEKTKRLYELLAPDDFSDGSRVLAQADRLRARLPLDPSLLGNAFGRPLAALVPEVRDLREVLRRSGAKTAALSGAGPAHYVPLYDPERAHHLAASLREQLGAGAAVDVVAVCAGSPHVQEVQEVQ